MKTDKPVTLEELETMLVNLEEQGGSITKEELTELGKLYMEGKRETLKQIIDHRKRLLETEPLKNKADAWWEKRDKLHEKQIFALPIFVILYGLSLMLIPDNPRLTIGFSLLFGFFFWVWFVSGIDYLLLPPTKYDPDFVKKLRKRFPTWFNQEPFVDMEWYKKL